LFFAENLAKLNAKLTPHGLELVEHGERYRLVEAVRYRLTNLPKLKEELQKKYKLRFHGDSEPKYWYIGSEGINILSKRALKSDFLGEWDFEYDALFYIKEAMQGGTWPASAWFLERKYPQRYGKRDVLKQQIYHIHIEFVRIVLEIINDADPAIKAQVLNELKARKIDIGV